MLPLLAALLIALLAMLVRAVTGFGSALVMSPLLLLFLDVHTAVVASAAVQVVTGFGIAWHARLALDRAHLKMLLPAGIIGIIAGTLVLVTVDAALLKRLLGLVTVLFALRSIVGLLSAAAPARPWPRWAGYIAGGLSGFLGSIFGTSGPPIVIFLNNQRLGKAAMRATMLAYFLAIDSTRLAGYVWSGLLTPNVLVLGVVMLPGALLGSWLGTHLHLRIGERAFRWGVALLLFVTGALLLIG